MPITTMKLATCGEVPLVGLGLWKISNDDAPGIVEQAITAGYRHLDSACDYGNEAAVGTRLANVLRAGKVRRQDLWITSKLWNTYHAAEHVRPAVERTLRFGPRLSRLVFNSFSHCGKVSSPSRSDIRPAGLLIPRSRIAASIRTACLFRKPGARWSNSWWPGSCGTLA